VVVASTPRLQTPQPWHPATFTRTYNLDREAIEARLTDLGKEF